MNNTDKLKVTYPDNLNEHEITVAEFKERFKEEGADWMEQSLKDIEKNWFTTTRMGAMYERLK